MKHDLCLTGSSSEDFTSSRNVGMRQRERGVFITNISEVITILFSMNNSSFFLLQQTNLVHEYYVVSEFPPSYNSFLSMTNSQLSTNKDNFDEWKTNLMSLAILFHLLCAPRVSDINISVCRSLRLFWWITTSVVLFCKDGCFSVSVTLRCVVVCLVWCVLSPTNYNKATKHITPNTPLNTVKSH